MARYYKKNAIRTVYPDIFPPDEIDWYLREALGSVRRREAVKVRRKALILEQARLRRLAMAAAKLKPGADAA